jgi:hypothetical protein
LRPGFAQTSKPGRFCFGENMTDELMVFAQLLKVDVIKRQVWGAATAESPDRANPPEVMDFELSLPNFAKWSGEISKATDGKSLGNVREMHQPSAVGKVIHFEPRIDKKDFFVGVEVVDEAAWNKVLKGVYTGFSIGGSYGKKWRDGDVVRYEAKPSEISLVDYPCHPGATFEFIKADGQVEMMKFTGADMQKQFPPAKGKDEAPPADDGKEAPAPAAGETEQAEELHEHDTLKAKLAEQVKAGVIEQAVADEIWNAIMADEKAEQDEEAGENPAQEQAESAQPAAGESGTATEAQTAPAPVQDKTAMRAELLALLEELGLVERVDGAAKAVQSGELQKAMQENELQKAEVGRVETALKSEISKLAGEVVSSLAAVNERLGKVTGLGPIISMRPGDSQQGSSAIISDLKQRQASTSNPMEKQQIGNLIAQLEMQRTQPNQ